MGKKACELCGVNYPNDICFGVMLCNECRQVYSLSVKHDQAALEKINRPGYFANATPKAKVLFENYVGDKKTRVINKAREAEEYKANIASMMMTTGTNFEGYVITEYIDVICEEVVFKNNIAKHFGAGIQDMLDGLSLYDTELTGTTGLIGDARKHTMEKFRQTAAHLGANAVLGIDFETSFGSGVARVAISGTAVKIRKVNSPEVLDTSSLDKNAD